MEYEFILVPQYRNARRPSIAKLVSVASNYLAEDITDDIISNYLFRFSV